MTWPEAIVEICKSMPYQVWILLGVGTATISLCLAIRILRRGIKIFFPGGGVTVACEVKKEETTSSQNIWK